MKKLILILLFVPFVSFSQGWGEVNIVDEFGDRTGEKRPLLRTKGTFSNSATSKDNAYIEMMHSPNFKPAKNRVGTFRVELFEYDIKFPVSFLCDNISMSIKLEDGRVYDGYWVSGFEYTYGAKTFQINAPTPRMLRTAQKKNKAYLYTILSTYKGNMKAVIRCGESSYRFNFPPLP
tara:strand:+ start:150 stop:680 length:531 start_codon:yes stop_codon:yes gene_type:complete